MADILKERLKEAAAGGVAALGVVATFCIGRAVLSGATAGDWLAFAGAVFGVLGALVIAFAIPRLETSRRDRVSRQHIRNAAADLVDSFQGFENVAAGMVAQGRWDRIRVGRDRLKFEQEKLSSLTHEQFVRLRGIDLSIEMIDKKIQADPELLDPLTFYLNFAVSRDGLVRWLREIDTMFAR